MLYNIGRRGILEQAAICANGRAYRRADYDFSIGHRSISSCPLPGHNEGCACRNGDVRRTRLEDLKSHAFRARMILPSSFVAAATVFDMVPNFRTL